MAKHIFTQQEEENIKQGFFIEKLSVKNISKKYNIGIKLINRYIKENTLIRDNIETRNASYGGATSFKDETGNKYNRLTVIKPLNKTDKDNRNLFLCQCDCGSMVEVSGKKLRSGAIKSCGCLKKEKVIETLKTKTLMGASIGQDLTGNRYGKLLVIQEVEPKKKTTGKNMRQWLCKCDCGNEIIVQHSYLTMGDTKSCGCINFQGEIEIYNCLLKNNIDFIYQYSFDDLRGDLPYRYDFGILKNNQLYYLIEFDGEQHYIQTNGYFDKNRIKIDIEKNKYALEHNIPLIRIPYKEKNNIYLELLLLDTTKKEYIVTEEDFYKMGEIYGE